MEVLERVRVRVTSFLYSFLVLSPASMFLLPKSQLGLLYKNCFMVEILVFAVYTVPQPIVSKIVKKQGAHKNAKISFI